MSKHSDDKQYPPGVARGYTRVSTDDQRRSGVGLEVQEHQIKAFYDYELVPKGFRWGGIYRDEAVSGYKLSFLRRPAGSKLHEELQAGDFIIMPKLDRGFRTMNDCLKMVALWDDMDVAVRFLNLPADTRSPYGRLILAMFSAVAEFEVELARERNRAVAALRKSKGMPIGKRHPRVGFHWAGPPGKMELVPSGHDREVIELIVEWHIAGAGFPEIAIHLQKQNLKSHAGREWTLQRVAKAFEKEHGHLLRDGVLRKLAGGKGHPLILEWITSKLDSKRLGRLAKLYGDLGRQINDTAEEVKEQYAL